MTEHVIRMPDIGEGVAEAELVEWHVKIGDLVREEDALASVMTDKATVEIPSPVAGEVVWLAGEAGDVVAVGSELLRLKLFGEARVVGVAPTAAAPPVKVPAADAEKDAVSQPTRTTPLRHDTPRPESEKPLAAPAVRLRAREGGMDLRQVSGTGPGGRVTHEDLDRFLASGPAKASPSLRQRRTAVADIKLVGLRRRIAEKMSISSSRIPHITYIEEVDVSQLEELRAKLNEGARQGHPKLTLLPFLMRAMVLAVSEQPHLNGLFDDEAGVLHQHAGVHIGIATQTSAGLMVPVARHVEALDLWGCASELGRLAEGARSGTIKREELTGSTITITSLGAMGGVASTPIINHPEVAVVGVNKIMVRPVWDGTAFVPRRMMNLSSSFDHRVVDGFDAAVFVQRIKALLEMPALIFIGEQAA